ncbi:response regulator [Stakelama pacifica]|uniref:Response regulator receiver protein n=1 Tax=Stakelama pacifica TaxID=517720 RepID=A0A4R6FX34_9SPHN|nr:response regulator [Stakelama pacifica]MAW98919.1 two-component system response regulator [Sphingomonas sp.]TDN86462.1 response regulator receiver protein [Stakelama pacifica]GGO89714.1 response regulator [Stakelama pacifica]|tara:strand:- start:10 stop:378 length:369 start_codon:yes stop_codon:yes gene_type:complete
MSKTILTIDDSPSVRQLVALTLSTAGYSVIEAGDGAEGYEKATTNRVNAVITDLNMPVMNGLDFIRKYRAHPSSAGIPIIFLTTESDDALKTEARAAGATGWLVKPFKQDQMLAIMRKVVGA